MGRADFVLVYGGGGMEEGLILGQVYGRERGMSRGSKAHGLRHLDPLGQRHLGERARGGCLFYNFRKYKICYKNVILCGFKRQIIISKYVSNKCYSLM